MKKTILAVVALLCLCGTAAAQRHIEYKWRGVYVVVDGSYVMNINRTPSSSNVVTVADTVSGYALGISGGFQFRKEAGVGLGITYLMDPTGAFTQMPIFVELRSHFMRSRLTPFAVLQLGYTLPLGASSATTKIEKGGVYFGAQLGGRFAIDRGFAIGLHVGYKMLNMADVSLMTDKHKPLLNDVRTLHMIDAGLSLHF